MTVKIVAGPKSWIEGAAVAQLEKTALLPDMVDIFGMPDLHPGPGTAVGATYVARDHIFPHLVGSDIGCGMALWRLEMTPTKPERIAKKLKGLERGVEEAEFYLDEYQVKACGFEHSLGTIGAGNHFAEILVPDGVIDPQGYARITDSAPSLLLVHSGSRGYGEQILYQHTAQHKNHGLRPDDPDWDDYREKHLHALDWAVLNRWVIAQRIINMLGIDVGQYNRLLDVPHNFVEGMIAEVTVSSPTAAFRLNEKTTITAKTDWYHRKGAIPSNRGPVVIPGSRGAHSYLVEPMGDDALTGYSLSHGAGRKMSRRDTHVKFKAETGSIQKLERTKFNSVLICEDRDILIEEAPDAYKAIDRVIQDLVDHDLVRVIAMLKPVITYKVRR